jgi:hypothetical protein
LIKSLSIALSSSVKTGKEDVMGGLLQEKGIKEPVDVVHI